MERRKFIHSAGAGAAGLALAAAGKARAADKIRWKMVTSWPKNFPGLGTNANRLAELITAMSGGRLTIKVYGANELVPAMQVFDAVSRGTAQMGHASAYYWKGKHPAAQFFSAVPFGLTAQEMNAWLYHGGGMQLWQELYDQFGLVAAAVGNTGVQMAGWFNREITSTDDLKNLKMRIPGLGGEVLRRVGGTPVAMAGGEIFSSLQNGNLDASEWVGPYNDLAFGLYKVAKYYYYPGWHEPGSTMECMINKQAFEALPKDLQQIVTNACRVMNQDMLAEFTARNNQALETLVNKHGVVVRPLPDDVLIALRKVSEQVVSEIAEADAFSGKVYASLQKFQQQASSWTAISEQAFIRARALG